MDNVDENSDDTKQRADLIRENYLKHRIRAWEKEQFLQLSDEELVIMDSWNRTWVEKLELITRDKNIRLILLSSRHISTMHVTTMAMFRGLYGVEGVLEYQNDLGGAVTAIFDQENMNEERYAVLSRMDYRRAFGKHAIWIRDAATDPMMIENRLNQLLVCDMKEYYALHIGSRDRTMNPCPFYKVVFWDIDGVLNDEGEEYEKGVVIDSNMVACLKYIVDQTGADIILSSSWKKAYYSFIKDGFETSDGHLIVLHEQFAKAGLEVSGITPFSFERGCEARPYEIIEWLRTYKDIFSFVILDDDTFWKWGFLQRNVVTTQRYDASRRENDRYVKGLTMEHAYKAVAILNEQGAFIERI